MSEDILLRTRVKRTNSCEHMVGTVVDFGCDGTPQCLHGEYCITVSWDGKDYTSFEDERELVVV